MRKFLVKGMGTLTMMNRSPFSLVSSLCLAKTPTVGTEPATASAEAVLTLVRDNKVVWSPLAGASEGSSGPLSGGGERELTT